MRGGEGKGWSSSQAVFRAGLLFVASDSDVSDQELVLQARDSLEQGRSSQRNRGVSGRLRDHLKASQLKSERKKMRPGKNAAMERCLQNLREG